METTAYQSMRDSQDSHWWFVGRREVIRSLIDTLARPKADAAVLEAGCGFGGNLPLLRQYGRLQAFEYDARARDYAASHAAVPVAYGALPDDIGFGEDKFDLIAMLDVLEHVDDDLGSLAALRERLSDGGSLLITVPAVPALWSEHDEVHHHKRRYSKAGLKAKLAAAGLIPRRVGYFNSLLFPLALAERLASRFGRRQSDGAVPAVLNALFARIFAFESRLLRWLSFPIGLSLYAVVEKAPQPE